MSIIAKAYMSLNKHKFICNYISILLNIIYSPLKWHLRYTKKKLEKDKKYYISICAIFRNEGHNFKEWIEYHRLVGIDHIYLYNNFSEDNYLEILTPYIENGYVTLQEWPYKYSQMQAYEDCLAKHKDETFWLAFIDLDEFICPKYKYNIKDWIIDYEGYPAVTMYWQMFGTNGIMKRDHTKLVIEQFTSSWEKLDGIGKYFLCTDDRFATTKIYCHHVFTQYKITGVTIKLPMINENKQFVFFPMLYKIPKTNTIQLNHYFSKSYEEFKNKANRGSVATNTNDCIRKKKEFFINHEMNNISENRVIFRFLTLLKEQMQID